MAAGLEDGRLVVLEWPTLRVAGTVEGAGRPAGGEEAGSKGPQGKTPSVAALAICKVEGAGEGVPEGEARGEVDASGGGSRALDPPSFWPWCPAPEV